MNNSERKKIRATIVAREKLRPLSRWKRLLRAPLRTLPFYFLAALSRLRPYQLRFKTLWGDRMQSYLPEGNTFYYYGYCEANLANFFLRYVQPGMVCIDVGAHVGFYTMLFARLVDSRGKVLAFEPTPWTYALLKKNTKEMDNVKIFQKAVSDTSGEITLADYGPGYGAYNSAHVTGAADLSKESRSVQVETVILDDHLKNGNLAADVIKIDAEGFEHEVLLGLDKTLSSEELRPLVSIEVAGGKSWAEGRSKALQLLQHHQYQLFEIAVDGLLKAHTPQENYGYDNLVAIPKEKLSNMAEYIL